MRKSILTATLVAVAAFGLAASSARADGVYPCKGPFCNQSYLASLGHGYSSHPLLARVTHHHGPILPVYQAAPWYLYFPYDAHFQTPAPVFGMQYPPPGAGYGAYPYFPYPNAYNPYPMRVQPAK